MKYWGFFIGVFLIRLTSNAQTTPALKLETDEYSRYIIPDLSNGMILLEAHQDEFQSLMKQYGYQIFQRGYEYEYLSPTSRVNQMRLIRKEKNQVYFLLSPTNINLLNRLEQAILASNPSIRKDSDGMTWYTFRMPTPGKNIDWQIGIKKEADKEDRVGRTWDIWSSTIIFSRKP